MCGIFGQKANYILINKNGSITTHLSKEKIQCSRRLIFHEVIKLKTTRAKFNTNKHLKKLNHFLITIDHSCQIVNGIYPNKLKKH